MDKSYPHRTLVQKLGIKQTMRILFVNQIQNYQELLSDLPEKSDIQSINFDEVKEITDSYNFIQVFVQSQERLSEIFPLLKNFMEKNGMLWICWPKGHCDIRSNLNENIVRDIGLINGLVDIKIISVNENWSGLKFVYRLKNR